MGQAGVQFMVSDSWEAGALNWTEDMVAEFTRRRGYDPRPWLPVLTGRVADSAAASDGFLFDFCKTLGDMIADNHYGELSRALHARGMGRYGESQEDGRAMVADGMQAKKSADIPMGALWATPPLFPGRPANYDADIRESASVAHLYGQNLVAAESFTAAGNTFGFAPETLKPVADRMMADGLNRFIIHTSAHQPLDGVGPGVTLGPFGQWFTRNETWAEDAGPWVSYLARSSLLLQQGRFVADVAWFYGEDDNITSLYGKSLPEMPAGYAYDFINADALTNLLSMDKGDLVTPAGARFRVLVLDKAARRMSLPVLRKLRDLVQAGATIVGERPAMTPSLADDPAAFEQIANALWGLAPGPGKVAASRDLSIAPDATFEGARLRYVHRLLPNGDIYFVANPSDQARSVTASFRTSGLAPEIWRADSGATEPVSYVASDGRTAVPLALAAHDTVFVVFRGAAAPAARQVPPRSSSTVANLSGTWTVTFQPKRGAPAAARFPALRSWTTHADAGIKYFSGAATYHRRLRAPAYWFKDGARLVLNLGSVKNVARVTLNGQAVGVAWKAPFELDVTEALKPGDNMLEITVTNLWPNRLIGDKQPGATRIATSTYDDLGADSPLLDSGLLGPVTLRRTVSSAPKSASSK